MGHRVEATCLDCGEAFSTKHGGGFFFHLVRCDKCGETKSIGFDELGELHRRYVKGLEGPYCMASAEQDEHIQKHVQIEPISEDEYYAGVEAFAGNCDCGGKYTRNAPVRCPNCRSTRVEEGEATLFYD